MKSLTVAVLMLLGLTMASIGRARAETAVGAVFGYPGNVGLSLRFDRTPIGVAWSEDFIHGTIDVWVNQVLLNNRKMSFYYGPGLDAGIPLDDSEDFFLATRLPIGLQFMASPKLELFGEIAPGVQFLDELDFYYAGSVGIRFVLGQ